MTVMGRTLGLAGRRPWGPSWRRSWTISHRCRPLEQTAKVVRTSRAVDKAVVHQPTTDTPPTTSTPLPHPHHTVQRRPFCTIIILDTRHRHHVVKGPGAPQRLSSLPWTTSPRIAWLGMPPQWQRATAWRQHGKNDVIDAKWPHCNVPVTNSMTPLHVRKRPERPTWLNSNTSLGVRLSGRTDTRQPPSTRTAAGVTIVSTVSTPPPWTPQDLPTRWHALGYAKPSHPARVRHAWP